MSRLAAVLAALLAAGCASYQFGPTGGVAPGARSVQVDFFKNNTAEPRLLDAVNSALRKRLQQDGTLRLDTRGTGDIVLSGALVGFDREGVSFQPGDVITARDFNLRLTARIKAVERASGKVLLEREVRGRTTVRAGSDLASAERQAIPLLAEDLARNATSLLVEGAW